MRWEFWLRKFAIFVLNNLARTHHVIKTRVIFVNHLHTLEGLQITSIQK